MANSANPEINKKIATSALGTLFIATVFFYLGDRYAETLVTYPGQIFDHLGDAMLTMWETIGDLLTPHLTWTRSSTHPVTGSGTPRPCAPIPALSTWMPSLRSHTSRRVPES